MLHSWCKDIAFICVLNDIWTIIDRNNFAASASLLAVCPSIDVANLDIRENADKINTVDVDNFSKNAPLGKSMYKIALQVSDNPGFVEDSTTIHNIPELSFRSANSLSRNTKGIYLLNVFIKYLGSCLNEINLKEEWGDKVDNASDAEDFNWRFHHHWSMLNFIYLSDHVSVHTPADIVDEETSSQVKNEDAFGHGFSIAGCLFLHLLDQRDQFKLFDYNRLVKKLHDFEEVMTQINIASELTYGENTESGDKDSISSVAEKDDYIRNLNIDIKVQDLIFSILQACCSHVDLYDEDFSSSKPNHKFDDEFI